MSNTVAAGMGADTLAVVIGLRWWLRQDFYIPTDPLVDQSRKVFRSFGFLNNPSFGFLEVLRFLGF